MSNLNCVAAAAAAGASNGNGVGEGTAGRTDGGGGGRTDGWLDERVQGQNNEYLNELVFLEKKNPEGMCNDHRLKN